MTMMMDISMNQNESTDQAIVPIQTSPRLTVNRNGRTLGMTLTTMTSRGEDYDESNVSLMSDEDNRGTDADDSSSMSFLAMPIPHPPSDVSPKSIIDLTTKTCPSIGRSRNGMMTMVTSMASSSSRNGIPTETTSSSSSPPGINQIDVDSMDSWGRERTDSTSNYTGDDSLVIPQLLSNRILRPRTTTTAMMMTMPVSSTARNHNEYHYPYNGYCEITDYIETRTDMDDNNTDHTVSSSFLLSPSSSESHCCTTDGVLHLPTHILMPDL